MVTATNVLLLVGGFAFGLLVFYGLLIFAWMGIMFVPLHQKRWKGWDANWSRGVWVGSGLLLHRVLEKHATTVGLMENPPTTQEEWAEFIRGRRPIYLAHVSGGLRRSRHHRIDRTVLEVVLHPPETSEKEQTTVVAGGLPAVIAPHGRPVVQGLITGKACEADEGCGIEGEWMFRFHVEDGMTSGEPVMFLRWQQRCFHYGATRYSIAHWQPSKKLFFGTWYVFNCFCPIPLFDNGPMLLAPVAGLQGGQSAWVHGDGGEECADLPSAAVAGADLEAGRGRAGSETETKAEEEEVPTVESVSTLQGGETKAVETKPLPASGDHAADGNRSVAAASEIELQERRPSPTPPQYQSKIADEV